jgi:predicted enzyme related to lactoylglutathione lyase
MSTTHGTVFWSELRTRDVDASRASYEAACGWQFETADMPDGPYHIAMAHGRPVAGMMDMSGVQEFDGMEPHWFTYIAVDDLDAALAALKASGGKVLRAPFEVPETGTIALVRDAGGAEVGLMTPVPMWDAPANDAGSLDNVPV